MYRRYGKQHRSIGAKTRQGTLHFLLTRFKMSFYKKLLFSKNCLNISKKLLKFQVIKNCSSMIDAGKNFVGQQR